MSTKLLSESSMNINYNGKDTELYVCIKYNQICNYTRDLKSHLMVINPTFKTDNFFLYKIHIYFDISDGKRKCRWGQYICLEGGKDLEDYKLDIILCCNKIYEILKEHKAKINREKLIDITINLFKDYYKTIGE